MVFRKISFLCGILAVAHLVGHGDAPKSKLGLHTQFQKAKSTFTPQQWTGVKVAGGMMGTAAIHLLADKYVGNGTGDRFYNGQYAWGFAQSLKLSGACLSVAPMLNEEWGDALYRWGMRAPVVAAGAVLIAHPNTQKLASYAPLGVGQHLSTWEHTKGDKGLEWHNKCGDECQGICNRCFIPKAVLTVGLYKILDPMLEKMGTAIGQRFGFIQEEADLQE